MKMHLANLLLTLTLSGAGLAQQFVGQNKGAKIQDTLEKQTTPTKRWIIEFAKGTDHKKLAEEIAARNGTKILKIFESDIFSGVSVEAATDSAEFLKIAAVNNVWKSKKIQLAPSIGVQKLTEDVGADFYDIHYMTGVDKLHKEGVLGAGARVAIIDTGTWYTHPALGGGFGPGFKVAGGYDFVGDGFWPSDPVKFPDDDPLDVHGHGTHVAGIVAGKSEHWVGVAPEATLLSFKVFSQESSTDEDTLIEAFLAANEADVDVITASIGGAGGWSDNAWAEVASRIVETGTIVTIAAGNFGDQGPFFGSNGASGKNVLAVASVEASVLPANGFAATITVGGASNTTMAGYLPADAFFPPEIKAIPVIVLSTDGSNRDVACTPLPANTPNLADSMVLVPRSKNCQYYDQQDNLKPFGAKYIMFFNDDQQFESPWNWDSEMTTGMIQEKAGLAILEVVAAGGSATFDFSMNPENNYVGYHNAAGGVANYFTSFAGTYALELKPEIAAPGGDIFSTYLQGGYAVMSGTSMATPYVAGVAALYVGKYGGKKVHGKDFAKMLAGRIMSSGGSLRWSDGLTDTDYGFWAPVPQVGNGLVNAYKVLTYDTSLSFSKFALNDTHHFARYQKVAVTNNGKKAVSYKFSIQDAGAFESLNRGMKLPTVVDGPGNWTPFTPIKVKPAASFPGNFRVEPGQTKVAEISFNIPEGIDESAMPVYSGKILVSGTNGEELSVPYFGVGANLERTFNPIFEDGFPITASTLDFIPWEDKPYFTFDLSVDVQDFPKVGYRNRWGLDNLRWDVFEAGWSERDWTFPLVPGKNGYVGAATSWINSGFAWVFDPSVDSEEDVVPFPMGELYRSSWAQSMNELWWLGRLADGTQIKPGNYTLRFAALAPWGNPTRSDNWAILGSPEIQVLPKPAKKA